MDPQKKDETRNRLREEALARRVGEALDQLAGHHVGERPGAGGTSECPDAGLIAAYHDRAVSPEESAQCEHHFATCSRCRKVLAVLSAVETPLAETEIAHLGKLVAASSATVIPTVIQHPATEVPARKSLNVKPIRVGGFPVRDAEERIRVVDWRRRLLAPALGIAAVLAVWFSMRPPWRTPERSASEVIVAEGPKSNPGSIPGEIGGITATQSSSNDRSNNRESSSNTSSNARSTNNNPRAAKESAAPARAKTFGAAGGTVAPQAAPTQFSDQVSNARPQDAITSLDKKEKQTETDSKTAAQAIVAAPRPESPVPAPPSSTQQSVTVTEAAPAIDISGAPPSARPQSAARQTQTNEQKSARSSVSDLPLNGRNTANLALAQGTQEFAVQTKAPSGAVLWRAGIGGRIERSTDAGRTWTSQPSPSQDDWLAGVAVNDRICWLVGRHGAITRTIDGQHWERIVPAFINTATAGPLPDWIGISARDAQNATITSDGRIRFVTQDGGKTWRAQ